jgi:hypothetical protein
MEFENRCHADTDTDNDDSDEDYSGEGPFELVDFNVLPPLPKENDDKYLQKDAKYFRTKNFVRKDKYDLSWFFPKKEQDVPVEIPELLDHHLVVDRPVTHVMALGLAYLALFSIILAFSI